VRNGIVDFEAAIKLEDWEMMDLVKWRNMKIEPVWSRSSWSWWGNRRWWRK
jgi:hypothetical protein